MASVGIYEVSTHRNLLYVYCRIARAAGHDVTVFTTEAIAESLRSALENATSAFDWQLKADNESLRQYLRRIEPVCDEKLDLLFVQSMYAGNSELPFYLPFSPDCVRLLGIYNVNRWLKAGLSVRRGPRSNLHTVLRRLLLRKFDAITIEYPPMARYARTECSCGKEIFTLLPTLLEGLPKTAAAEGTVRVTVPGRITPTRRDYDLVLAAFETLFERYGTDVALDLLGKPVDGDGEVILDRCADLKSDGYDVTYYDEWVPMDEFEETLRRSTLVLAPIRQTIEGRGITEQYGTTKGSGNLYDALRTATPFVVPDHFQIDDSIAAATLTYRDRDDLERTLATVVEDRGRLASLTRAARENAEQFRLQPQADRFDSIVDRSLALRS